MTHIRFAHLPQSVLRSAQQLTMAALPTLRPMERAMVAARLRKAVTGGHLRPDAITRVLGDGPSGRDAGVLALGRMLGRRARRRVSAQPALPAGLRSPFDPRFDAPAMRGDLALWLRLLLRERVLVADDVRAALASGGGAAAAAIRRGCEDLRDAELKRLLAHVGVDATDAESVGTWRVMPACVVMGGLVDEGPAGTVIAWPDDDPCGFTALNLGDVSAVPHFEAVCDALRFMALQLVSVVMPAELTTEGVYGGMMFEEISTYAAELVAKDGNVTLTDDFLEHMANEYGLDTDDPAKLDELRRLLRLRHHESTRPRPIRTAADAIAALDRLADDCTAAPARAALRALAQLIRTCRPTARSRALAAGMEVNALSEECGTPLMHVVGADLSGFELSALDEMSDMNMQVGTDGAAAVRHEAPMEALRLAVSDACRICVLDLLLTRYVSAFR
ncbi:hypothetical protein [Rhodanobacter sp. FW106-PBR-R2A-1-13]|uniref:hypothetical protein n=1 Tax=Rhodanobacter sp. FW106-PBR-R2A-1-13 TaxID=3454845 RepID=UPI0034E3EF0C